MRRGEINWFWVCLFGAPLIMIATKGARMDSKERHEVQMRVKHRSDFWLKGNEFVERLRRQVLVQAQEGKDKLFGSEIV